MILRLARNQVRKLVICTHVKIPGGLTGALYSVDWASHQLYFNHYCRLLKESIGFKIAFFFLPGYFDGLWIFAFSAVATGADNGLIFTLRHC